MYILNARKKPIRTDDPEVWHRFMSGRDRFIAKTVLASGHVISTVFLGTPHCGGMFETMVFADTKSFLDLDAARYETHAQALRGHRAMVRKWKARGTET